MTRMEALDELVTLIYFGVSNALTQISLALGLVLVLLLFGPVLLVVRIEPLILAIGDAKAERLTARD